MNQNQRQQAKILELQSRWNLLSRKLQRLEEQSDRETRVEEQLRMEPTLRGLRAEREQVEAELAGLEDEKPAVASTAQPSQELFVLGAPASPPAMPTGCRRSNGPVEISGSRAEFGAVKALESSHEPAPERDGIAPRNPIPSIEGRFHEHPKPSAPIELFYSYAHEDEDLRNELNKHLKLLERQGVIGGWHDRQIGAGSEWAQRIDAHLESAGIILLLISADFIASDYCWDVEMKRAMERHKRNEARVIPVILRPLDDWRGAPFSKLQVLPRDAKPVTAWDDRDAAFADVARGIRLAIGEFSPNG